VSAEVFLRLAAAASGIAAGSLAFVLASAPSREGARLGLRGLKRERALATSPAWRRIEPVVRWLGARLDGILPGSVRASLDESITRAGDVFGLCAPELAALAVLGAILGAASAVVVASGAQVNLWLALILLVPVGLALPSTWIGSMGHDRLVAIGRGLPFVIDLMSMAMSAGLDFPGAVRQVIEKAPNQDDPLIEELAFLSRGLKVGRSRRDVLDELARRAPCRPVAEFTAAAIQAEERGNPLAEVLQIQASTYRAHRTVKAEESAAKASVQMTGPLFLVFISVLLLLAGPVLLNALALK
jgi:tight adherence protein C